METKSLDKMSFDDLYDRYAEKVYNTALYYSKDHHVAEDITQSVFMTLYTVIDNVNIKRIEAWLKATAKYMAIDYVRKTQHEELAENNYVMENKLPYAPDPEEMLIDWYDEEMRAEVIEEVYLGLYQKNERWYQAVTVIYLLEKPQKEVAENMGISLGSLQLMLHRAKKWIRKEYQEKIDHLNED